MDDQTQAADPHRPGDTKFIVRQQQVEAALQASEGRFHSLLQNIPSVAVQGYGMDGTTHYWNQASEQLYGYSAAEAIGQNLLDLIIPPEMRDGVRQAIQQMATTGQAIPAAELTLRHKDGSSVTVFSSHAIMQLPGQEPELFCIDIDLTERKRIEVVQNFLAQTSSGTKDEPFFKLLARFLAETLDMDFVCIDRLEGDGLNARTLAVWHDGHFEDNVTYALKDTPCGDVVGKTVCCFPASVSRHFPRDQVLKDLRAESYVGVTLWSHAGQPIGLIAVIGHRPLVNRSLAETTLKLVAARAAGELERLEAEAALRKSEQNYREIFDGTNEAIFLHDAATGRILDVNAAMLRMYGFATKTDVLTADLSILDTNVPPYTRSDARCHIQRAIAEGPQVFEWLARKRNGETFWVEVSLRSSQIGGQGRILAVVHDITQRKQVEAALQREQRFAQALIDSLPGIFYLYTYPECRLVLWNKRHESLLGYNPEELKGFHVTDWHQGEAKAAVLNSIEVMMKTGSISIEAPLWSKTGRAVPFVLTGVPFESQGKTYFMGIGIDITERKQAEEAHTRLATVVEQATEIIVITDISGTIIYVNPAFEKIAGYTRTEAVGQNPRILKSGKQDAGFYRQLWDTLKQGEVWRGHLVNRRKDGTLFEEEATISPVRDATGKIVNYVAVKRDVTREVQLENQLRQSQKMEAIGQLAGGVAHDFNNILASMIMQTELASVIESLPAEALEGLKQIRADANRAAELTRQLLLFSRRQVMQARNLDLNETVINLTKMLQRIIGEDVRLQLHLHATPLWIHADPGMMDQVVMNLTVNARDAMPNGGRLLIETSEIQLDKAAASQQPDAVPGSYVCLSVADTGSGIPPEVMPQIFDPFFTTKDVGKGTGLGLATVFGIVKQHRGWITVDNQPGQGVRFQIFFPTITAPVESSSTKTPPKPSGGTETILVVEDEASVRAPICTVLKRHGYQVLEATNGLEAIKLWSQHHDTIALLLTDLVMPEGVNGQELAQRLQTEKPALKVIFTSGYSAEIAGREVQLRSGENFIPKPFTPDQLLKTIRQGLDN